MVDNVKKAATEEKRRRWSGGLTLTLSPTLTQTLALSPALALSPTLALTLTRWSGGYSEPTRDGEPPAYGTRDSEPDVGAQPLTLTLPLTLPLTLTLTLTLTRWGPRLAIALLLNLNTLMQLIHQVG